MDNFKYTEALVCRIPDTLYTDYSTSPDGSSKIVEIDLDLAKQQFENYVRVLRKLGLDVLELSQDNELPFSSFTEDLGIGINGNVFLFNPSNAQRKQEIANLKPILKKELNVHISEPSDSKAFIEGGDVLFTGKEFFVGISSNTNEAGARCLAETFPDYSCSLIKMSNNICRLKNLVSCFVNEDILTISDTKEALIILKQMELKATYRYKTLTLPYELANCLFINGTLVYRSDILLANNIIHEKIDFPHIGVDISELAKANGTISRFAFLIGKHKNYRKL